MRLRFHINRGCVPFTVACLMFGNLCSGQVLEYATVIHMEPNRVIEEVSYFIQVNGREQDEMAEVSIYYNDEDKLDILEASILERSGKTARGVGKKEITTRHDISRGTFFENSMVKEFTLKWNTYPYWVRYRYRITTSRFIYACNWIPLSAFGIPVKSTLQIDYPKSSGVRIFSTRGLKPDSSSSKGRIFLQWGYTAESTARQTEVMSGSTIDRVPRVIVAPEKFMYGIPGTLDSWPSFGAWQTQLNAGTDDLPPTDVMRAQNVGEKSSNKMEVIRGLYHYLQDNTRYVSISLGDGGYKSFPASYVAFNKYGDCKALTVYMQSQLRAVDIPSFGALVFGDENPPEFFKQVPGPQFNHIILCVPMDRDTLWLENTANFVPTGYLGTFTQNRDVLVVNGLDSKLVRTPALTADQVLCRRSYAFDIDDHGGAHINARWELRGDEFETFKAQYLNQTPTEFRRLVERGLPGRDYHLGDFSLESPDRDSAVVRLKLTIETEDVYRVLGSTRVLREPITRLPEFEAPSKRTTEVKLPFPLHEEQTLRYTLPLNETGQVTLPNDIYQACDFGWYRVKFQKIDRSIVVERAMLIHQGKIPLDRYPAFYQFIQSIKESERRSPITISAKS